MLDKSKPQEPCRPNKDDLDDILRRVDSLPILDPRSPDEILGYDENGLPTGKERARWHDFEAGAREILGDRILEDFLKYRHREWEENLGKETKSGGNTENSLSNQK